MFLFLCCCLENQFWELEICVGSFFCCLEKAFLGGRNLFFFNVLRWSFWEVEICLRYVCGGLEKELGDL